MNYFLGIDPGASGGLCLVCQNVVRITKMPATEYDTWRWLYDLPSRKDTRAVIEKVGGYVGEAQPGSSAFKFGMSYGGLRMALIAAGISFEEVTPQRWMKGMGLGTRGKTQSKTEWKNALKGKAQQIYPDERITLAVSDAILIATFCKRKHEGKLG